MESSGERRGKPARPADAPRPRGRPPLYTIDDIIGAAKEAFSRNGYANVSLDDLAAHMKTRKGTVYYHAARKVDLLISISENVIRASLKPLNEVRRMDTSSTVRFVLAVRALMYCTLNDQLASKVYFENEANLPPDIRAQMRSIMRSVEEIFVEILAEGVRSGEFTCDPRMGARHTMGICLWPYRWYVPSGTLSMEEFIDSAADFALGAVRGAGTLAALKADNPGVFAERRTLPRAD